MFSISQLALAGAFLALHGHVTAAPTPFAPDQHLERTCFQTSQGWLPQSNLRSDVAIVYGVDPQLPARIATWRDHGYRIHVMTGVSWGNYQDYLYGRFDGINHEDEAQTERNGQKISHGGDVYYMCPGTNFGKFLCLGVQRALDAGAEAIHMEEPEFWVRAGYSEGFKREWKAFYGEDWQAPHSSVNAQWRASKLKYYLYRRALQQVFDYIQDYNARTGRKVRCYVPTHSLLSYAHWRIVSPESSLGRLKGCDGYIAQVWTGTARTPNMYRGAVRERTFESAFLEYGVMQNLVRSTGRTVWYLNDPVEDNPNHDWEDYRVNWESTLVASLMQPDVWQYEVAPWPERVFAGKYPRKGNPQERESMPPAYGTELQVVMNALNDMKQPRVAWSAGSSGLGILASDSLMFQRGDPTPGDPHLSNVYGLALPFLKRAMPITPLQLEYIGIPGYLDGYKILLLSYNGQKPLDPEPHQALSKWVRKGGLLVVVDDDSDPYNKVTEWWNTKDRSFATPREHLFETLGIRNAGAAQQAVKIGRGQVLWLRENPVALAGDKNGDSRLVEAVRKAATSQKFSWKESNGLVLRRGPYVIAAGLDESISQEPRTLQGRFVSLFDPELRVRKEVKLQGGSRWFLMSLDAKEGKPRVLATAARAVTLEQSKNRLRLKVEGVAETKAIMLLHCNKKPKSVKLADSLLDTIEFSSEDKLLWVRFDNTSLHRENWFLNGREARRFSGQSTDLRLFSAESGTTAHRHP
jgi:hypothetical protein